LRRFAHAGLDATAHNLGSTDFDESEFPSAPIQYRASCAQPAIHQSASQVPDSELPSK